MLRTLLGCGVALFAAVAVARPQLTLPSDTDDFRARQHLDEGNSLDVALASFRTVLPDGMTRLTYNVCNLHHETLIFLWEKPWFEAGFHNPLGENKCAVLSRDVPESILDRSAPVRYWQRGDSHLAQAFLQKQSVWEKAERKALTFLYERGLGPGPDKPEIRDVELEVTEYKGHVYQYVKWTGRASTVALWIADPHEKVVAQLREQIGKQGKVEAVSEFVSRLSPVEQDRFPTAIRKGFVLVVTNQGPGPAFAKVVYELGDSVPSAEPIVVLDASNRVVWIAQYSTVRPR